MEREQEMARELLKGTYDLHVHSAPSHVKRALNDYQLMEQAQAAGMAGVMIKNCLLYTSRFPEAEHVAGLSSTYRVSWNFPLPLLLSLLPGGCDFRDSLLTISPMFIRIQYRLFSEPAFYFTKNC